MNKDLESLIKQAQAFANDIEDSDVYLDMKVQGNLMLGSNVEIQWFDRPDNDSGYIFRLPGVHELDVHEGDVFIHIPYPDNSEGIGDVEEVFIHLNELVKNDRVKFIICHK